MFDNNYTLFIDVVEVLIKNMFIKQYFFYLHLETICYLKVAGSAVDQQRLKIVPKCPPLAPPEINYLHDTLARQYF